MGELIPDQLHGGQIRRESWYARGGVQTSAGARSSMNRFLSLENAAPSIEQGLPDSPRILPGDRLEGPEDFQEGHSV